MLSKFNVYNKEIKEGFLKYYSKNKDTLTSVIYAFQRGEPLERQLDKDLSQMNIFEVDQMAKSIDSISEQMIRTILSIYSSYTDWCILNVKDLEIDVNSYRIFLNQKTDLKEYVSLVKAKNMYITEEDVDIIIDRLVNAQDKAYILALYEGIRGTAMSELRNMKIEDIDNENNTISLYDDNGSKRTTTISEKLKNLLHKANNQKRYLQNNGVKTPGMLSTIRHLRPSEYILKAKAGEKKEDSKDTRATAQNMSMLVQQIRKYLEEALDDGENYSFITPRSIYDSGMINLVIDAYDRGEINNIEVSDLKVILQDYKLSHTQLYNTKNKIEFCLDKKYLE